MARMAAIGEGQWFELADALAAGGETPSVKALHAFAKERFGVAASFTTIQRILESWRRLGGTYRPSEMTPQALDIVLKGFTPLYQQLLAQARSEFEPRVLEAESQAQAAALRAQQLEAEFAQLLNERQHWREQLNIVTQRERDQAAALASAQTRATELQALLEGTAIEHQQRLAESQLRVNQQEERHARERAQLLEQHRATLAEVKESFEAELSGLLRRTQVEIERRDGELTALRESLQQAETARSALSAQKNAVDQQLHNATTDLGDTRARVDALTEELKSAQGRVQRSEQALRDARAANSQMESAYQQRINQLQTQLDALVRGQAAIQHQFEKLASKIARSPK